MQTRTATRVQRQRPQGQRGASCLRELGKRVPIPSCTCRIYAEGVSREETGPYLFSSLLCASAPCWMSLSRTSAGEVEGGQSSSAFPFAFFNSSLVFLLTK